MAFTQTDIDTIKASIALGALEVRYADGRLVKYRSFAEMQRTLTMMQAEVAGAAPATFQGNRVAAGYRSNLT